MGDKLVSELSNILQCIIEFKDEDPAKRSAYFGMIQKHARKTLEKLEKTMPVSQE